MTDRIKNTIEALKKNNMDAVYLETKEEVVPFLKTVMGDVKTVSNGGSATLKECGVIEYLQSGGFEFFDRSVPDLTREQTEEIFRKSFFADCYFTSSNAVTTDGKLYNVDGNGNRVAAIVYGPKKLYVIVGENKIVDSMDDAILRVKGIAAPLNTKRLNCPTYCEKTGCCIANEDNFDGCDSDGRICCSYLVSGRQRVKDRITVIIVGEKLGF